MPGGTFDFLSEVQNFMIRFIIETIMPIYRKESEKSFRDEMQNKLAVYFVAKDNGKCIGYAGLWNVSGEGDITNVAVLPKYRKNGIGSMLISEMIKTAVTLKLELLTLEVRKSNIAAQGLYKKYGFDIIGERKRYYSDNGEDAWIMTKSFEPCEE